MGYFRGKNIKPKRGDIYYIANSKFYATDPMNEAGRPGIIVSSDKLNSHAEVVEVVYLTTKDKHPMPTHTQVSFVKFRPQLCVKPFTQCRRTGSVTSFAVAPTKKWQRLIDVCSTRWVSRIHLLSRKLLSLLTIQWQSREIFTRTFTNLCSIRWFVGVCNYARAF